MSKRSGAGRTLGAWLLGVLVVALVTGTVALTALALSHVRGAPPAGAVPPPSTFTPAPVPETSAPEPEPVAVYDRAAERFLSVGTGVLWRGVAGECGVSEPLLERSEDAGESWTDVTPRYLEIAQLTSVDAFADTEADIVAAWGEECEVQLRRTFSQGAFWDDYSELLDLYRHVSIPDPAEVLTADGPVATPCEDPRSFRAAGEVIALVCDGTASVYTGDEWSPLPAAEARALTVDDGDVVVAHLSDACEGLALTRYADASDPADLGCAPVADPYAPAALAVSGDDILLWSGDDWLSVVN